jgi:protein SCO1
MRCLFWLVPLLLLTGCGEGSKGTTSSDPTSQTATTQVFQVKGVIKSIDAKSKTVEIRHEEVPGFMVAMTMPFDVKSTNELSGLQAGDNVLFRLNVTGTDSWVDQIRKLNTNAAPNSTTSSNSHSTFRLVRDVDPLQVGDPLPEYHFTNELGQAVSTAQFKGQALAITFIFTRCPLPNFCPKMSSNFNETQKLLLNDPQAPTNWHLLTISFDPDFDTPAVLKAYAERFGANPKHWDFLTGEPIDVTAISTQFGQLFWQEEGAINHNLRTAVIDASGNVEKIFQGNAWTPEELAAEIKAAAAKRS